MTLLDMKIFIHVNEFKYIYHYSLLLTIDYWLLKFIVAKFSNLFFESFYSIDMEAAFARLVVRQEKLVRVFF